MPRTASLSYNDLVGHRVEGGECPDDYDVGTVEGVEGETAYVSWDSGVRTSTPAYDLRPIDCVRWRVICTHPAGWPDNDRLWSCDYELPHERVFYAEDEAEAALSALASYDYAATIDLDDDEDPADYQPTFAVERLDPGQAGVLKAST